MGISPTRQLDTYDTLPQVTVEEDRPSSPGIGMRVMSPAELARWAPLVHRHAVLLVERAEEPACRVGELCVAGFHALVDALAMADRVAPEVESDRYVAGKLLRAMQAHQREEDHEGRFSEAEEDSRRVARAIADLGPAERAPRVTRAAIVLRLGLSLDRYEDMLLRIAEAGLARINLGAMFAGEDALELAEAIDALTDDACTLLSLLYEHDCSLEEAAMALGWSLRAAKVEHVEILHRLRVALGRA